MTTELEVRNSNSSLLSGSTPKVRKKKDLENRDLIVDWVKSYLADQLNGVNPLQLNFFEGGADAMDLLTTNFSGIRPINGVPGRDGLIVLTINGLFSMRSAAWEYIDINYFQLNVHVNPTGAILIQTKPGPYNQINSKNWKNWGKVPANGLGAIRRSQEMIGSPTTATGQLATGAGVAYSYSGGVDVFLDGSYINCWDGIGTYQSYTCYFCVGNTTTPRRCSQIQIGDTLRWNYSNYYHLEGGESIRLTGIVSSVAPSAIFDGRLPLFEAFTIAELTSYSTGSDTRLILYTDNTKSILYKWDPKRQKIRTIFEF